MPKSEEFLHPPRSDPQQVSSNAWRAEPPTTKAGKIMYADTEKSKQAQRRKGCNVEGGPGPTTSTLETHVNDEISSSRSAHQGSTTNLRQHINVGMSHQTIKIVTSCPYALPQNNKAHTQMFSLKEREEAPIPLRNQL